MLSSSHFLGGEHFQSLGTFLLSLVAVVDAIENLESTGRQRLIFFIYILPALECLIFTATKVQPSHIHQEQLFFFFPH